MTADVRKKVGSTVVTTGRVVSNESRQWADGEIDDKTYFDQAWREARDLAARDVKVRLHGDDPADELAKMDAEFYVEWSVPDNAAADEGATGGR